MKIVLQRVKECSVSIEGKIVSRINKGLCLLVGIEKGDSEEKARFLAGKIVEMRIFQDDQKKMNRSLLDINGEIMAVSQFTLVGSIEKGRRPSFISAEQPERAKELFDYFVRLLEEKVSTKTGVFGAYMDVKLVNDGPVTFFLEK